MGLRIISMNVLNRYYYVFKGVFVTMCPMVTIIVPVYNAEKTLRRCIYTELKKQNYNPNNRQIRARQFFGIAVT